MLDLSPDDITDGPLLRALIVLATPLLAQNFVQVIQQVVDLFWVGRLSSAAVAAVGLVAPLVAIVFAVAILIPFVGTQVLVSQRIGGENVSGARSAAFSGITFAFVSAVVIGAIAFFAARPLVDLMVSTQPGPVADRVSDLAVAYFGVIALGLWVSSVSDTTEGAYIGWGDSQAALYMNLLAIGINITLDPILIFGFRDSPLFEWVGLTSLQSTLFSLTGFAGIGVEGAALSNIIGYGFGGLLGLILIARGRNGGMISRATATFDLDEIRELVDIGAPTGAQNLAKQFADLVLVLVAFATGGAAGLAAYFVGFRVASVAVIPSGSLQQAGQSIVGQNLGAGRTSRARRVTWLGVAVSAGVLGLIGLVQLLVPGAITRLLVPDLSPEAFGFAVEYLVILAYGYPAIGAAYMLQSGFNGARRTRTSFVASMFQYWGVRLPIAVVGGIFLAFGVSAVFWAVTLSNIAAALGLAAYYRYSTDGGMLERAADEAAAAS